MSKSFFRNQSALPLDEFISDGYVSRPPLQGQMFLLLNLLVLEELGEFTIKICHLISAFVVARA